MRILHVCLGCFYIENMAYQENVLPKMHSLLGHTVKIIASQYTFSTSGVKTYRDCGSYINPDNIPVTIIPYRTKSKISRILKRFKNLFQELTFFNPDIIFVHGAQFFGNIDIIKFKRNFPSTRVICDNHSDYINTPLWPIKYYFLNKLLWPMAVKRMIPITDFFWGVTPMRVRYLQEIYKVPSTKTDLLIMGGDDTLIDFDNKKFLKETFRNRNRIREDDFLLITGGKIGPKKNIQNLVHAFSCIKQQNVHLLIFGDFLLGMEDLQLECINNPKIHLLGWLTPKQTYDAFLSSDLAVFPGTHSVLWEQSVACGIPVVFRRWPDMQHVSINGNCVFLDRGTKEEISHVINEIIDFPDKYSELVFRANEAKEAFSYINIAKKSIE